MASDKQYTRDKLESMSLLQLRAICVRYNVEPQVGSKRLKRTYIEALKTVKLLDGKPLVLPIQYGYEPPTAS